MEHLLAEWDRHERSDRATAAIGAPLAPEIQESGSILRPAATENEISAAESRLGLTFPLSYRTFLLLSNGAWAGSNGPDFIASDGQVIRSGFLPVNRVARLETEDPDMVRLWADGADDEKNDHAERQPGQLIQVRNFEPLRDAIVIGERFEANVDLLIPSDGQEWAVWKMAWEGATAFESFADLIAWRTNRSLRR